MAGVKEYWNWFFQKLDYDDMFCKVLGQLENQSLSQVRTRSKYQISTQWVGLLINWL